MQFAPTSAGTLTMESLRADFPLLAGQMRGRPLVFLDSAASSQKPTVVLEALDHYYRHLNANVHRGVYELSQVATDAYEQGRERARRFLNAAESAEIIFTKGCTDSINLVAASFGRRFLHPGDEVIISAMEHHANIVPWQMICEERGATLRVIPVSERGELMMDEYASMLNDHTRIVAVTHVSNTLGTINPIEDIIALAHAQDVPVLLDGAQAAPHLRVDVQALDVDFYTFSGHKVFGPTGIGVLYGKRRWLDAMPPYQGGGGMIATVAFEKTTYNELPHKFEAGTPDMSGVVGLGVALEYIEQIGQENIAAYEHELLLAATPQLEAIDGLRIIGTAAHKASVISFVVDGMHPFDIGTILDKLGIAVRTGHHCNQPLMAQYGIAGTVRASFALYNNHDDVAQLVAGVQRAVRMLR
jgi:cysteine desulfurase/selenocysteine lyase